MAVDLSFFRSETSQRLRAESRAEDILLILTARGLDIPEPVHERITSCTDLETLRTWLTRAVTVGAAEDVFVETGV
ncbi:hypothetical protein [Streptomyces sp. S3(2020)]|uniref:hypothetical protein n=1 Tax=Streptomyces sp. S3(2020) TaxID=2732044 RepID=UPI003216F41E